MDLITGIGGTCVVVLALKYLGVLAIETATELRDAWRRYDTGRAADRIVSRGGPVDALSETRRDVL